MPIAGDNGVTVPLTTQVGNERMEDLDGTWDPWADNDASTWANDYWWNVWGFNGPPPEVHDGHIFFEQRPWEGDASTRTRGWWVTDYDYYYKGNLNLTDSSVFFRFRPFWNEKNSYWEYMLINVLEYFEMPDGDWVFAQFYVEVLESGGSNTLNVYMEMWWYDDATSSYLFKPGIVSDNTFAYDAEDTPWIRFRHDTDTVYIEVASQCNAWTTLGSIGSIPSYFRLNHFYIGMAHDATVYAEDETLTPAFIGPLNPAADNLVTVPLLTVVDTLVRAGDAGVTVPLNSEIGEY